MENDDTINVDSSQFRPDFEMGYTKEDLEAMDLEFSELEQKKMEELCELSKNAKVEKTLFKDLLEATKQGALNYLDSFTDTGDTFDEMKNSQKIRQWNETEIDKKIKPATPQDEWQTRTMADARTNPFDKNVSGDDSCMSDLGKRKFASYQEAYKQRTKSVTNISTKQNVIARGNKDVNFESLSGLRGYRIGPVVPVPTVTEAESMYQEYKASMTDSGCEQSIKQPSAWLMEQNYKDFDKALMDEFGFKKLTEASAWRKSHHLTIHEGPDGMFLVPSDVHDKVSHNGYRSKMSEYLNGKITKEDVDRYIRDEKIAFVKHEAKTRSVRALKGIGMSLVKDLLKNLIFITGEEAYIEFTKESDEKFVVRFKRFLTQTWVHLKKKCANLIQNLWNTIKNGTKGALISEFFTLLNDFVFKTAKNILKIVRTMWNSIYKAFKVIFSSKSTWGERIFEASKILVSGFVGVVGFSLNELIEKGLVSIGIPFASFIAECLSGLFAGIMSSLVLVIFDNIKGSLFETSPYLQQNMLQTQLIAINSARIDISTLKVQRQMMDTLLFVGKQLGEIKVTRDDIEGNMRKGEEHMEAMHKLSQENKQTIQKLESLKNKLLLDEDF